MVSFHLDWPLLVPVGSSPRGSSAGLSPQTASLCGSTAVTLAHVRRPSSWEQNVLLQNVCPCLGNSLCSEVRAV